MFTTSTAQTLPAGQHATPPGPAYLTMMNLKHCAFQQHRNRFRTAPTTADIDDCDRWRALRQRRELVSTVLLPHHAAEDAELWPFVVECANAAGDNDAPRVLEACDR